MIPSSTNSVRVLLIIYLFFSCHFALLRSPPFFVYFPYSTGPSTLVLSFDPYSDAPLSAYTKVQWTFFSPNISSKFVLCLYKWLNMQNTRFTKFQLRTYINIFACFPPWLNFAFPIFGWVIHCQNGLSTTGLHDLIFIIAFLSYNRVVLRGRWRTHMWRSRTFYQSAHFQRCPSEFNSAQLKCPCPTDRL